MSTQESKAWCFALCRGKCCITKTTLACRCNHDTHSWDIHIGKDSAIWLFDNGAYWDRKNELFTFEPLSVITHTRTTMW